MFISKLARRSRTVPPVFPKSKHFAILPSPRDTALLLGTGIWSTRLDGTQVTAEEVRDSYREFTGSIRDFGFRSGNEFLSLFKEFLELDKGLDRLIRKDSTSPNLSKGVQKGRRV